MICERCGDEIEEGEEREVHGNTLCEDCTMDVLSPTRTCDPWAVHSAKTLMESTGGEIQISPVQKEILEVLKETGGLERPVLAERIGIQSAALDREIAALRHMEKVRAAMVGDKKVIRLW